MSKVGEILINATREKMEFHQRNASGKASASLKEVRTKSGIQIVGVDYFDEIFNGIPAGGNLTLKQLGNWAGIKQARYGVGSGGRKALSNILFGNAWVNSQPDKLHLDNKTLTENRQEIDIEVKKHINKLILQWK